MHTDPPSRTSTGIFRRTDGVQLIPSPIAREIRPGSISADAISQALKSGARMAIRIEKARRNQLHCTLSLIEIGYIYIRNSMPRHGGKNALSPSCARLFEHLATRPLICASSTLSSSTKVPYRDGYRQPPRSSGTCRRGAQPRQCRLARDSGRAQDLGILDVLVFLVRSRVLRIQVRPTL